MIFVIRVRLKTLLGPMPNVIEYDGTLMVKCMYTYTCVGACNKKEKA